MSQFTGVKCDQCGKAKGEANAWLTLVVREQPWMVLGIQAAHHPPRGLPETDVILDICSYECVSNKLSELLPWLHA